MSADVAAADRRTPAELAARLAEIHAAGTGWGHSAAAGSSPSRVLVEFVSAPPHAALTVAHGRGGVVGDVLAALLTASGAEVQREFYVNDAPEGRPLRTLAHSVLARYRTLAGSPSPAANANTSGDDYPDTVAEDLAHALFADRGADLLALSAADAQSVAREYARERLAADQRALLDEIGIRFDTFFSERDLQTRGAVGETVNGLLRDHQASRHADGSIWLHTTRFGDESDRALIREDGTPTYLAGDLAYHADKFARGFDRLVDVWNADHATYVARTRAGLSALGLDPARLDVILCQPVRLLRDGTELKGASPGGSPTLRELVEQIGPDAARFALLLTPATQPLDLDIDAAARSDAPLGRIRAALETARNVAAAGNGKEANEDAVAAALEKNADARDLAALAAALPTVVREAAENREPHRIATYAVDLAKRYAGRDSGTDAASRAVAGAVAVALGNALALAGVSDAIGA